MPGGEIPNLITYQANVNNQNYAHKINSMLNALKHEYWYNELKEMIVLKDILYNVLKNHKII